MKILLLGMNHRTAPLEVRERFAIPDLGPALTKLVDCEELEEAVIVSTCNRVDVLVTTRNFDAAKLRVMRFLSREVAGAHPLPDDRSLEDYTYAYRDSEAMAHVFRVASSIDSMVVGEPQILGQMKDAYREAIEHRTCGPILSRLLQRAFATAKRVRNETRIAERPTSVARVAVELAKQIFETLEDKSALMVGAGEMIELAMLALQREGLQHERVANRTRVRAEALAERFSASAHGLEELPDLLTQSDIVLTCISADAPVVSVEQLRAALRMRRNRPIFLIDIGVPRNVDPHANDLDNVYLYDVDDLQGVVAANTEQRKRASLEGERIVLEEQQRFDGWLAALRSVPTIRHLRARADEIQAGELSRQIGRLDLNDAQREGVEQLTRSIVNKILHAPLSRLRASADREEGLAMLEVARALFALDDPQAPGASVDRVAQELPISLETLDSLQSIDADLARTEAAGSADDGADNSEEDR